MIEKLFTLTAQISSSDVTLPNEGGLRGNLVAYVTTIALGFAGGIAFIVVVYGGIKYILSQGNPQETAKARDTILYGLLGLGFCVFAVTIITFVINRV